MRDVIVGTAGWSLPKAVQPRFPAEGTHLARYAGILHGAEINSSFYRPHRPATYAKWAASVPPSFRFAVKVPRTITHERALADTDALLDRFLGEARALGAALGPLLLQLPPSGRFDEAVARAFLASLRQRHEGPVVLEARHPSWFTAQADTLLVAHDVAGVAADPARVARAAEPSGSPSVAYYRLHGSPVIYRSRYDAAYLAALAGRLLAHRARGAEVWCIFDNTAAFAAIENALELQTLLQTMLQARTSGG